MQRKALALADNRVSRVRTTLISTHDVRVSGEQIDDLALALVAPLGADDYGRRHEIVYMRGPGRRAGVLGASEPRFEFAICTSSSLAAAPGDPRQSGSARRRLARAS